MPRSLFLTLSARSTTSDDTVKLRACPTPVAPLTPAVEAPHAPQSVSSPLIFLHPPSSSAECGAMHPSSPGEAMAQACAACEPVFLTAVLQVAAATPLSKIPHLLRKDTLYTPRGARRSLTLTQ
eukprot:CAMPEP_0174705116 /NCGR_PEP_ID=MMETSP1094-20130205/8455_1 /TAXON_ID=156173 /ORGANISM="Chrysochromulina brevifilum, Strain UTEX LB 985" /LENGTH=123 /DNA_ID=CAMNT_0015903241 /DNA_START=469 /DNA_END=841 /DNA_ORIENTATION=-